MYPDVIARERSINMGERSFTVHGSFVNSGLKDLRWLVNPTEWGFENLAYIPHPTVEEPEVPAVVEPLKPVPPRFAYSRLVLPIAEKYGMDWRLVAAVMAVESNYNPRVISYKGAVGLMQVMPSTAAQYKISDEELTVPARNIEAGVRHLKMLNERYKGELELVVAAYNSGEGAVDRHKGVPPYKDTRTFVRKVMYRYKKHLRNSPHVGPSASGTFGTSASTSLVPAVSGY
jgi:soluble lytic murein transglycosylase-like protein